MGERRPVFTVYWHFHRGRTSWQWICDDHRIIPTFTSEKAARDALAEHLRDEHSHLAAPSSEGGEGP